tara:strand:+ start:31 stop:894 length:864 start_codon:yes stop_codon:yes gene_type:complete
MSVFPVFNDVKLDSNNQQTQASYYKSAATGDFEGTLDTLADDVFFEISGDRSTLPFAGRWEGKENVKTLFSTFGSAFRLLNLTETDIVESASVSYSFNDESFFVYETGIYYRVPVLHIMSFNSDNKISSLVNIHDTSSAYQAFTSSPSSLIPISPKIAPPSDSSVLDDAYLEDISTSLVKAIFSGETASSLFAENLTFYIPGLQDRDKIAGVWTLDELKLVYPDRIKKLNKLSSSSSIHSITKSENRIAIHGSGGFSSQNPWVILASVDSNKLCSQSSLYFDFQFSL